MISIQEMVPDNGVVVSDAPWAVAWYAKRPAVWLPVTPKDFEAVDRKLKVQAVYYSSLLQTYPASERALMWQQMFAARALPPGFAAVSLPVNQELLGLRSRPEQGTRRVPPTR